MPRYCECHESPYGQNSINGVYLHVSLDPTCPHNLRRRDSGEDCNNGERIDCWEGDYCPDGFKKVGFNYKCDGQSCNPRYCECHAVQMAKADGDTRIDKDGTCREGDIKVCGTGGPI